MDRNDRKRPEREGAQPVIGSMFDTRVWFDDERPIPADIYPVIDTDLGRDNVENDLPAADLEDL